MPDLHTIPDDRLNHARQLQPHLTRAIVVLAIFAGSYMAFALLEAATR